MEGLPEHPHLVIGVDIGGTFTDFVVFNQATGDLRAFKVLSTPSDPAEAVLKGMESVSKEWPHTIVHGSTVATNALLERKGAKTALVTTKGFRDILTIGRQTRRRLYDLVGGRTQPLIPEEWCYEIIERIDHQGRTLIPVNKQELPELIRALQEQHIEAVAVSCLYSFVSPAHEAWVAEELRQAGMFVSASHELVPEFREYERTSTTAINAYVSPILNRYLGRLAQKFSPSEFHILQSNGGRLQVTEARREGVRSILSGPAGGVVGAVHVARLAGFNHVITFDMGGTSTDVSLVKGGIQVIGGGEVGGWPLRIPIIDIHTVGAGGGSYARLDRGVALRVGPESAGADPGPVCYGRGGTIPTVTDANLILGRLPVEGLLGGQMGLDWHRAAKALETLATQFPPSSQAGGDPLHTMAQGIVDVVNAQMTRAIRVISVERGHDPRECVMVSFGGAGGMQACDLARSVGVRRVVIPPFASTLSALGMLVADVALDYVQTVMRPGETAFEELDQLVSGLVARGRKDLRSHGVPTTHETIICELDLRYVGQSYELTVPLTPAFRERFDEQHVERYGYCDQGAPIEIVNIRVRAIGITTPPLFPQMAEGSVDSSPALIDRRQVVDRSLPQTVPFFDRSRFYPGNIIEGPAVIVQSDTTTWLGEGDRAVVDRYRNLVIDVAPTVGQQG